jgi:RNA polymerase-binding protein DksA
MVATYEQLKAALERQREELTAEIESLEVYDGDRIIGYKTHQADVATHAFDQAANLAMRNNAAAMLREVEDALSRLAKGTYGRCENCGVQIDIARLEAIPYTRLCMDCAEARDYRAGS